MNQGSFYFVNDQYYIDFPDDQLMRNKETIGGVEHNRPAYYSIKDPIHDIYWLIPISSQVSKFRIIYNKKISSGKTCDTIVFGYVLGKEKAFLIQNIFPVTDKYILNEYKEAHTNNTVTITDNLASELHHKAMKVLGLQRKGIKIIFPDVLTIEKGLLKQLGV